MKVKRKKSRSNKPNNGVDWDRSIAGIDPNESFLETGPQLEKQEVGSQIVDTGPQEDPIWLEKAVKEVKERVKKANPSKKKLQKKEEDEIKRMKTFERKKQGLEREMKSIRIPEPRAGQDMTPALEKKRNKALKDLETKSKQLEHASIQIEGLRTGVLGLVYDSIVEKAYHYLCLDPLFRPFWFRFQEEFVEGKPEDLTQFKMAPPFGFTGTSASAQTYGIIHCLTLCHETKLLYEVMEGILAGQAGDHTWWSEPETGLFNTPLHLACLLSNTDQNGWPVYREIGVFLARVTPSQHLYLANDDGDTPLVLASFSGALETVKVLIEERGVEIEEKALFLATENGQKETIEYLLEKMYDDCQVSESGYMKWDVVRQTLMHIVVQSASRDQIPFEDYRAIMELLQQTYGIDLNTYNVNGETPLHVAAKEQSVDPISIDLLERGADFNALDNYGRKPIEYISYADKGMLRDMFAFYCGHQ